VSGTRAGSSVVEAVVATLLAGLAVAARDSGMALALAAERLEALRGGPRANGSDGPVAADGTRFVRIWSVTDGRGAPSRLSVQLAWGRHSLTLATDALP